MLAVIAEDKRARYGIVRVPVAALSGLGLTVVTSPSDTVAGHVVIPELNSTAFQDKANTPFFVRTQLALATIASEHIILSPGG